MARQQRFDWFLSQQRRSRARRVSKQKMSGKQSQLERRRQSAIEPLEDRVLLSVNASQPNDLSLVPQVSFADTNVVDAQTASVAYVAHDHNGDGVADHTPENHDPGCCCPNCTGAATDANGSAGGHEPGCCCEQCLGMTNPVSHDHDGDGIPDHSPAEHDHGHVHTDGFWYVPEGETLPPDVLGHNHAGPHHDADCCCDQCLAASGDGTGSGEFTAFLAWDDQDLTKDGHQITYSYSNLFDGGLPGGLSEEDLRAATEESLALWASVTPLNFIEVVDSGPLPDPSGADIDYPASDHPNIRIGHHFIDGSGGPNVLAHAYFPPPRGGNGQSGDVHFDNGNVWGIGLFLETMIHELGHSLGLGHEPLPINGGDDAIMNPIIQNRFSGLGEGFLLPDDIEGIQFLYGESEEGGSVEPLTPFQVNTLDDVDDTAISIDPDTGDDVLVDSTPDIVSLREAIKLANDAGEGRKVTFADELFPDLSQTYTIDLTLGTLDVTNGTIIEGPGSGILTVQAPDASPTLGDGIQLFNINNEDPASQDPDTVAEIEMSGLTLTGGDSATAGGAIFSSENLSLTDVYIHTNYSAESGGAIFSTGLLKILSSTLAANEAVGDGGAIHSSGGVHLTQSTVSSNQSGDEGGAIAAEGVGTELIVISSTLSGNTAVGNGGAIHNIDDNPTKFRVLHSTVYQNTSGGSGGGIYFQDGVLALEHSIVAGNSDVAGSPDLDNINQFDSPQILTRYSLIQDVTGSQLTQQGPNLTGVDPMLMPLADNGGPTLTHEPIDGSPALNGGNPNIPVPPENDQRGLGFSRILEGVIDIGALESGGFEESFTVNSLEDTSDLDIFGVDQTPNVTTLREALQMSNLSLGQNLINFDVSLNGGVIELSGSLGEFVIADATTIDASDLSIGLTISALSTDPTPMDNNGDGTRIFRIDDGGVNTYADVKLMGLTLRDGDVTGDGGAIHSVENLELVGVSVVNNYAVGNGGGVYHRAGSTGGTLRIDGSTIANNEATLDGGGVWSNTNLPAEPDPDPDPNPIVGVVLNSTVSNNLAGDEGGGIMNFDGQLEIRHSTVTANEAAHGSGVVSFGDALTKTLVYSSIIAGNVINVNDPLNSADDTGFDVQRSRNVAFNSFESLGYNLIGTGNALLNFNNNDQTDVMDPMLRPLGNYGGKTQTHALLTGSPAVDSSDPDALLPFIDATEDDPVVTEFDQRGDPFTRIADGDNDGTPRLDIGAFELPVPEPNADFDNDSDIDGSDFLAWQRGFGTVNAQPSDGDADNDGDVDADDLQIFSDRYGTINPAESDVPGQTPPATALPGQSLSRRAYAPPATNGYSTADISTVAGVQYLLSDSSSTNDYAAVGREGNSFAPVSEGIFVPEAIESSAASHLRFNTDQNRSDDKVEEHNPTYGPLDEFFEVLGKE